MRCGASGYMRPLQSCSLQLASQHFLGLSHRPQAYHRPTCFLAICCRQAGCALYSARLLEKTCSQERQQPTFRLGLEDSPVHPPA